jgi:hypothetical protein
MANLETSFYSQKKSTHKTKRKEIEESPQTSNGFYQNFLRLDLLTRTTKGVFQDIVPERNN